MDEGHITLNKNAIRNDPEKPTVTSGVRIGTPAVTTRGFRPEDMDEVAECIALAIADFEGNRQAVIGRVAALTSKYPIWK